MTATKPARHGWSFWYRIYFAVRSHLDLEADDTSNTTRERERNTKRSERRCSVKAQNEKHRTSRYTVLPNCRRITHTHATYTKQNHSELAHELSRRESSTYRPQSISIDWRARRTSDNTSRRTTVTT
ncbi:unnamed protein product [Trichogramma brassicae]|uniref:Uncharacterized protein n=1 Tax=Trichogramma brassicae TaxID=86971 RepID=A0A6H5J212_9HYME|nr:unnamed protein product [Trichogramma brassicae]